MTPQQLMKLLESVGLKTRMYSGRRMYGKDCPAFEVESDAEMLMAGMRIGLFAQRAGEDCEEEMVDALDTAHTDNMGRGTVVYFPRYTFEAVSK